MILATRFTVIVIVEKSEKKNRVISLKNGLTTCYL